MRVGLDPRDSARGDRGLFRSNLDLDLGVLRVRHAFVTGYGLTFEAPKIPNCRRSAVLTQTAVETLLRHRERQAAPGFPVDGDAMDSALS